MKRIPGWSLPLGFAVVQLAAWPGIALAFGDPVAAASVATGVAATAAVAAALLWRRTAPLVTLGVVAAAVTVGTYGVPPDELVILSLADLVALFSVAILRSLRVTLSAAAAMLVWQVALITATAGVTEYYPVDVGGVLIGYAAVVAFGRARHRWHAERSTAASRLAEAEDRRARAADTERHRLARELHDVTAHHLTSIVVIASAAQRLGGTRPELAAEAREFAARTGRDTLAALQRLVALLRLPDERPGPAAARLAELVAGFRLLGQQVSVQAAPGDLPAATTEAVCGITREALTNTLRYAPAGGVRIRLFPTADGLELTVDDDGAQTDVVAGMGSGRGIAGMRDRAAALGGTLTAGPRPGGGWRVRAVLPQTTAPAPGPRPHRLPDSEHVIDVVLVLLALFSPVIGLLTEIADVRTAPIPLIVLVVAAHAVPLYWRRTHPWTVLGAVVLTTWAMPALTAAGLVAPDLAWLGVTGLGAEAVAVYAVARYGRPTDLTALAIPFVLTSVLATSTTLAMAVPPEDDFPLALLAILMAALIGLPIGVPLTGCWLAGSAVRRRRTGIEAREHDAVAAATAQAIEAAGTERARVAAGLRAAVLRDTARVASAADAGDLDQVLLSARAALDAMRGLLHGLAGEAGPARDTGERDPQPTAAALPGLARRWRDGGRQIRLEFVGDGRALPADVDLSVFRVVELLLAGDTGPVTVWVDLTGDPVRITMRPMPADEGGEIAAGLRARLAAVGGTLATAADGLPELLLPAPLIPHPGPGRAPDPLAAGLPAEDGPGTPTHDSKEVASSPSA